MAYHDDEEGILHLGILDGDRTKSNQETSFEVYNLPDSSLVKILCNGKDFSDFEIINPSRISLRTDVARKEFKIITGYKISSNELNNLNKKLNQRDDSIGWSSSKIQSSSSRIILPTNLISCSCC